jgi:quinol monooxygenase YgiN
MGEPVAWHVELALKPGAFEDFRALTGEMVEATRGEPGVLSYERFISADGQVVHIYERYADSAAAVAHLRTFRRMFGDRFVALVDRTRFTVYGTPSAELRGLLDGLGAMYLAPFGGFVR